MKKNTYMSQIVEWWAYSESLFAGGCKMILLQTWNFFSLSLLLHPTYDQSFPPRCHQVPSSLRSSGKIIYKILSFRYGKKSLTTFSLAPLGCWARHWKTEDSTAPQGRRKALSSSRALLPTRSLWGSNFLMQVIDIITQGH